MREDTCKHFVSLWPPGGGDPICGANINIRTLVGGDDTGWAIRAPCLLKHRTNITCECFEVPTPEEVEKYEKEKREMIQYGLILAALIRDAEQGRVGVSGTVQCPKCGGGVRYSIAENNHIHAACANDSCIKIME